MQEFINSDFFKFVFYFGIGQAILLTVLLFKKEGNKTSNRFLAVVFALCALELISGVFYLADYHLKYPNFIGLTNGFAYLFGPLLYFYIYFLEPQNKIDLKKILPHFIPFLIAYLVNTYPIIFSSPDEKIKIAEAAFNTGILSDFANILAPYHASIYIAFLLRAVYRMFNNLENNYSVIEFVNLYWLKYFFYGVFLQGSIVIILHLVEYYFEYNITYLMLFSIALFLIIAGYISLRQPDIKSFVVDKPTDKNYKKRNIADDEIENYINEIYEIVKNNKLYLNPKLSLKDLSESTNLSTHKITEILNIGMKTSFYDFINSFRVEQFKFLLIQDVNKTQNILTLAYESGFSSKTSFNNVFKKFTGKTPSEFRNETFKKAGAENSAP